MSIIEFLEARIAEDEEAAKLYGAEPIYIYDDGILGFADGEWDDGSPHLPNRHTGYTVLYDPARALAECAAKRAIIKQHEAWPVLVERQGPAIEPMPSDPINMTFRVSQEIAWFTEQEYVKRFGVQPPTAPMIRTLAAIYSDHPDYQQDWA